MRIALAIGVAWGAATMLGLVFAWQVEVGPSIQVFGTHGVHLGDVIVFALLWGACTALTWRAIATRPSPPSGAR